MRKVPVLISLAFLAGCGSETTTVTTSEGEQAEVAVDRTGDGANVRITGENGEQVVIDTGGADADLPMGFSTYPGATVVTNTAIREGATIGNMVILQSSASPEEIIAFYRRQAEAAGLPVTREVNSNGVMMIGAEAEDGKSFNLTASPQDGGGTSAMLTIGQTAQ